MPTLLTETVHRFCTMGEEQGYSWWQQNKPVYNWVMKNWVGADHDDEIVTPVSLRAVLKYMAKNKKAPQSVEGLRLWVILNPHNDSGFQKSAVIDDELTALKEYKALELDDAVLFDALVARARANWASSNFKVAASIALGNKVPGSKNDDDKGPSAAIQWIRGEMSKDISTEAPLLDGKLNENIPALLQNIESRLSANTNGKFPLGLPHIDRNVIVGRQNLRFIGVLGMSGDGKTTLTNQIVYNWLTQGAHILYVSTEHSPEEIWQFMAWLHQSHSDYDFTLPPMQDWEGGRETGRVTREDEGHLYKILGDIQGPKNLSGMLECKQFREWDAIRDYLETNHRKNKYDILVVDYIGRLDMPGDQKFRDKAHAAIVHGAQQLTREFDDQRGLIVLTPLQVNREANKRANAADEEATTRYDLNAISTISEYQHDLDLCLSVWSDADMKMLDEIEIEQVKQRKGRKSMKQRMTIDRNSGSFEYKKPDGTVTQQQRQQWNRTADDVLATTTAVDIGGI